MNSTPASCPGVRISAQLAMSEENIVPVPRSVKGILEETGRQGDRETRRREENGGPPSCVRAARKRFPAKQAGRYRKQIAWPDFNLPLIASKGTGSGFSAFSCRTKTFETIKTRKILDSSDSSRVRLSVRTRFCWKALARGSSMTRLGGPPTLARMGERGGGAPTVCPVQDL